MSQVLAWVALGCLALAATAAGTTKLPRTDRGRGWTTVLACSLLAWGGLAAVAAVVAR